MLRARPAAKRASPLWLTRALPRAAQLDVATSGAFVCAVVAFYVVGGAERPRLAPPPAFLGFDARGCAFFGRMRWLTSVLVWRVFCDGRESPRFASALDVGLNH